MDFLLLPIVSFGLGLAAAILLVIAELAFSSSLFSSRLIKKELLWYIALIVTIAFLITVAVRIVLLAQTMT